MYKSLIKQPACGDIIRQLYECREEGGWMFRILGGCQDIDKQLGKCLRDERIDRTKRNQEKAKVRNQKKQEAWSNL